MDAGPDALAEDVDALGAALHPIRERIQAHVLAGERLHGDDTTVPVLAKGKTDIARCWTYVRDDRPFGGPAPPAALFFSSRDRSGEHPQAHLRGWSGILQADARGGCGRLYGSGRVLEAGCPPGPAGPGPFEKRIVHTADERWAHARRKFFELADLAAAERRRTQGQAATAISPLALEALQRIDALFAIERDLNGLLADQRPAARQEQSAPLVGDVLSRIAGHPDHRLHELMPWNWTPPAKIAQAA